MKPRTRLHFEVLENSRQLHCINHKIIKWSKEQIFEHKGYATKNRVVCLECGEKFLTKVYVKRKRAICPHCGQKLTIEASNKQTLVQKTYVASAEIYGEFQVIRNFLIESIHKSGRNAEYLATEVLQHWVREDGKREVVGLNHTTNWYCDSWNGAMEIRDKGMKKYWEANPRYEVYPEAYHPDSEFKKCYSKYGINKDLGGLTFLEAMKLLPNHPQLETLLKAKQYSLLAHCGDEPSKARRHWNSIKILLRNKYKLKDYKNAGMWFDYIDLLEWFRLDIRNAHYVCPKDLQKSHDRLVAKKRAIQKKQAEEERKRRAIENEKAFQELKAKFFGLFFTDGVICINVLESVQEYVEEGDKLRHCVFTNNYFSKPDSLCLSARICGEPVETIELSLKDFKILQCRGKYNQDSEHHDRIIRLMNKNIRKIKQLTKQRQTA